MNSETHPPSPLTKKKTATRLRDSGSLRSCNPDSVQAESNGFRREPFSQSRSFFLQFSCRCPAAVRPLWRRHLYRRTEDVLHKAGGSPRWIPCHRATSSSTSSSLGPTTIESQQYPNPGSRNGSQFVIECNQKCTDICYRQVDDEKNEPTTKSLNKDYDPTNDSIQLGLYVQNNCAISPAILIKCKNKYTSSVLCWI